MILAVILAACFIPPALVAWTIMRAVHNAERQRDEQHMLARLTRTEGDG